MTTLANFYNNQLDSAINTVVSTTSSQRKLIGHITATNTGSDAAELTFWLLPSTATETTGAGGNWRRKQTIQPGTTDTIFKIQGHVIDTNMKLSVQSDQASVVNLDISGKLQGV